MTRIIPQIPGMIYGGDYNPEQWPESVWEEDAQLMRAAGVNLVSVAIFAWARLEPQPDVYDFGWLDRVLDTLHAHGVYVNLGTATPSPPPWLARMYPESLLVTANGTRLEIGSRRHYSPHSAAYRERARKLVTRLAEHYKDHPALVMWHIDNEYACHVAEDFSDAAAIAFRSWLGERYTTLDALNASWGSTFWGQIYGAWDEIQPPRAAPYMINPGHVLDWKRFCSDAFLACYEDQRTILKQITPALPVTTNFMSFFPPLDYWAWAAREDVVANDTYPDPAAAVYAHEGAAAADLMRALRQGQPWILMEQAVGHVNWRTRNATKAPGQMRRMSLQAVARGADGVMFFQWRQSYAGGEQFHSAMLPHAGAETRIFREISALGRDMAALAPLADTRIRAEVAIIFDWDSWWALELPGKPSADARYLAAHAAWHAALWARNIPIEYVRAGDDLRRYKLVLAPALYLVSSDVAASLTTFVANGGTLVTSYMSGIVNPANQIWLGGYPGPLRTVLGLTVEEFAPYGDDQRGEVFTRDETTFGSAIWADVIRLEGAEQLAGYTEGWLAQRAAVTRNRHGQGHAFYAGTQLDAAGSAWLLGEAATAAGVRPPLEAPDGVEVSIREGDGQRATFMINHTASAQIVMLPAAGTDLLTGERVGTRCVVAAGEVRVVV